MKYKLQCITCHKLFDPDPMALTCHACGDFKGTLDVIYPYDDIRSDFNNLVSLKHRNIFESFLHILPFDNLSKLPPVPVGNTPLFKSPGLSSYTGINNLWLKDDSRNPSGSLKDRASAVAIAMANESNSTVIAAASTGNAASSLATLAASAGKKAILFVPKTIPKPKLAQLLIHNAEVICLDCDYDTAFELCQNTCRKFGWYNRNTAVNPFTGEGKKTAALEIAVDLDYTPDVVICPVGDGCIISGLYKGFFDLMQLGLIKRLPRIYGIQASGAAPLIDAFTSNSEITPLTHANTIADSISVGYPRDGVKAMRAIKKTGGAFIAVSDEQILEAQRITAAKAGVFIEPAAAAGIAGLLSLIESKYINRDKKVVTLLTGHGLKDIDTVMSNIKIETEVLQPDFDIISNRIKNIDT